MFLEMQDFDFAQIFPKFYSNLPQFCPKNLLEDAIASVASPAPTALIVLESVQ